MESQKFIPEFSKNHNQSLYCTLGLLTLTLMSQALATYLTQCGEIGEFIGVLLSLVETFPFFVLASFAIEGVFQSATHQTVFKSVTISGTAVVGGGIFLIGGRKTVYPVAVAMFWVQLLLVTILLVWRWVDDYRSGLVPLADLKAFVATYDTNCKRCNFRHTAAVI